MWPFQLGHFDQYGKVTHVHLFCEMLRSVNEPRSNWRRNNILICSLIKQTKPVLWVSQWAQIYPELEACFTQNASVAPSVHVKGLGKQAGVTPRSSHCSLSALTLTALPNYNKCTKSEWENIALLGFIVSIQFQSSSKKSQNLHFSLSYNVYWFCLARMRTVRLNFNAEIIHTLGKIAIPRVEVEWKPTNWYI